MYFFNNFCVFQLKLWQVLFKKKNCTVLLLNITTNNPCNLLYLTYFREFNGFLEVFWFFIKAIFVFTSLIPRTPSQSYHCSYSWCHILNSAIRFLMIQSNSLHSEVCRLGTQTKRELHTVLQF